jgi:Ca2+/H+ antiporter
MAMNSLTYIPGFSILVGSRDQRTQFWKGAIQESFQQSLADIGSVVSEEKILKKFHLPFCRMCPNLNCVSIMMSFLAYMTGFFMNFELLPILTDYAN